MAPSQEERRPRGSPAARATPMVTPKETAALPSGEKEVRRSARVAK